MLVVEILVELINVAGREIMIEMQNETINKKGRI